MDTVQITVYIDLQHYRRLIAWPTRGTRLSTFKTQFFQIKLVNECIDYADRIIFCDVIFKALRE